MSSIRRSMEVSWQSILGSLLVAVLVAFSYPYIILKLGIGPNVSVLAAFGGALWFLVTARSNRGYNALGINIVQTAATAAASAAFMCVVYAAFDYLKMNERVHFDLNVTPWVVFWWLTFSGMIGVLFTAVFRWYFLDDEEMVFPDGVVAAKTIEVLDNTDRNASRQVWTMGLAGTFGIAVGILRERFAALATWMIAPRFMIGMDWSVLTIGTGMLIPIRVGVSMLLGTLLVAVFGPTVIQTAGLSIVSSTVAPEHLSQVMQILNAVNNGHQPSDADMAFLRAHSQLASHYAAGRHFPVGLLWWMWVATPLMIAEAITSLLLRFDSIMRGLRWSTATKTQDYDEKEVHPITVLVLTSVLTILLAVLQHSYFHLPIWQSILSVLCGLPLILVGVRVLGLTNQGPVSVMANALQVVFRIFSANTGHNLVAAGMAGSINAMGEALMQCFKTGQILRSSPRVLTWVAFMAAPIGAAAVAIMYPILTSQFELGSDLAAPTGLKLANMAVLLGQGFSALPPGTTQWALIAAVVGVLLAIISKRTESDWVPNAAGLGIAMILPGVVVVPMFVGSIIGGIWKMLGEWHFERYGLIVASGLVGGEGLIAGLIIPVMRFLGLLH